MICGSDCQFWIGIIFCVLACGSASLGENIVRLSFILENDAPKRARRRLIDRPLFVLGNGLTIMLNPIFNLISMSFAPLSVLSPLTTLHMVFNLIFSRLIVGERPSVASVFGTAFILMSTTLVIFFGSSSNDDGEKYTTVESVLNYLGENGQWWYIVFIVVCIAITLPSAWLQTSDPKSSLSRFASLSHSPALLGILNTIMLKLFSMSLSQMSSLKYDSKLQSSEKTDMAFVSALLFVCLVIGGLGQLVTVNLAISLIPTVQVIPIIMSVLLVGSTLAGLLIFGEVPDNPPMFLLGVGLSVGGVFALAWLSTHKSAGRVRTIVPAAVRRRLDWATLPVVVRHQPELADEEETLFEYERRRKSRLGSISNYNGNPYYDYDSESLMSESIIGYAYGAAINGNSEYHLNQLSHEQRIQHGYNANQLRSPNGAQQHNRHGYPSPPASDSSFSPTVSNRQLSSQMNFTMDQSNQVDSVFTNGGSLMATVGVTSFIANDQRQSNENPANANSNNDLHVEVNNRTSNGVSPLSFALGAASHVDSVNKMNQNNNTEKINDYHNEYLNNNSSSISSSPQQAFSPVKPASPSRLDFSLLNNSPNAKKNSTLQEMLNPSLADMYPSVIPEGLEEDSNFDASSIYPMSHRAGQSPNSARYLKGNYTTKDLVASNGHFLIDEELHPMQELDEVSNLSATIDDEADKQNK